MKKARSARRSLPRPVGPLTYLYALLRAPRAPLVRGAPPGVPGASPVRALAVVPGLWLLAADAPAADYDEAAIERGLKDMAWVSERALAHEAVVEHFAGRGDLLPMKLFTLFSN